VDETDGNSANPSHTGKRYAGFLFNKQPLLNIAATRTTPVTRKERRMKNPASCARSISLTPSPPKHFGHTQAIGPCFPFIHSRRRPCALPRRRMESRVSRKRAEHFAVRQRKERRGRTKATIDVVTGDTLPEDEKRRKRTWGWRSMEKR
jgi:hypothetical protein